MSWHLQTFTYTLILVCGHRVDHTDYVGVDPEKSWPTGAGRWCQACDYNSTVRILIGPTFNPLPVPTR